MNIPSKLRIISVGGPYVSKKTGRPVYVANAESPLGLPGMFSTIRWTNVSDKPPTFKAGDEIPILPVSFDFSRGVGMFNPAS